MSIDDRTSSSSVNSGGSPMRQQTTALPSPVQGNANSSSSSDLVVASLKKKHADELAALEKKTEQQSAHIKSLEDTVAALRKENESLAAALIDSKTARAAAAAAEEEQHKKQAAAENERLKEQMRAEMEREIESRVKAAMLEYQQQQSNSASAAPAASGAAAAAAAEERPIDLSIALPANVVTSAITFPVQGYLYKFSLGKHFWSPSNWQKRYMIIELSPVKRLRYLEKQDGEQKGEVPLQGATLVEKVDVATHDRSRHPEREMAIQYKDAQGQSWTLLLRGGSIPDRNYWCKALSLAIAA
jgi:hypothetical protein